MHWRHWRVGVTSVIALGVLAWCFTRPSQARPGPTELIEQAPAPVAPKTRAQAPQLDPAPVNSSPQELPRVPADSSEANHIGMQSHPITAEHKRIYRENNLIGDLNGAMDVADVPGMRRLLQQYREEYPEDAHVLQDGYALIADCLEHLADPTHPSPEIRAKAQRYYDEELASGLRRYIRRHCLEAATR